MKLSTSLKVHMGPHRFSASVVQHDDDEDDIAIGVISIPGVIKATVIEGPYKEVVLETSRSIGDLLWVMTVGLSALAVRSHANKYTAVDVTMGKWTLGVDNMSFTLMLDHVVVIIHEFESSSNPTRVPAHMEMEDITAFFTDLSKVFEEFTLMNGISVVEFPVGGKVDAG